VSIYAISLTMEAIAGRRLRDLAQPGGGITAAFAAAGTYTVARGAVCCHIVYTCRVDWNVKMWYSGTSEKNRRYIGLYRVEDVTGYSGGECHLIMSGKTVVLMDTGYDFCADSALEKIKAVLGGRRIDYILLTHSHYDHATGTGKIKRQYPGARVVASRYAAEIFKREGARRVMKELNEVAAKRAGVYGNADAIDELDADIMVQDGDVLRLNDMTVRVVGSPGHTKCSVCYFFEEERLLVACETLGIAPTYPVLQPCYVIGYKMTRDSIEAARKLDPKHVFIAHYGLIPDGDVCTYFDRAAEAAKRVKDIVLESYGEGMDRDGILDLLTERFYIKEVEEIQPLEAFCINYGVLIERTLADYGYELGETG